jgi:methionine biosynthesis protein MetW
VARNVSVIQQDWNGGLACSRTMPSIPCSLSALQMIKHVEGTLREIARVGREVTVSFPNFAYWPHRVALLRAHAGVRSLPYQWYDTPNLRCATIRDFEALANQVGLEVLECVALKEGKPVRYLPNCAAAWPCSGCARNKRSFTCRRRRSGSAHRWPPAFLSFPFFDPTRP